jgi:hypothetical protein
MHVAVSVGVQEEPALRAAQLTILTHRNTPQQRAATHPDSTAQHSTAQHSTAQHSTAGNHPNTLVAVSGCMAMAVSDLH